MSDAAPTNYDLGDTFGALEIGVMISMFLFGAVTVQAYNYYGLFPEDSKALKSMVAFVWLLEFGHTISITHAFYVLTVVQFGNFEKLSTRILPESVQAAIFFSGFLSSVVQAFFTIRLLRLSHQNYIAALCFLLSFLRFLTQMLTTIYAEPSVDIAQFERRHGWLMTAQLSFGATADVIIAISMCWTLLKQKDSACSERTTRQIEKLLKWTIHTGLITSMTTVTILILYVTMQRNFIWVALFLFEAKLFSNSLLAVLNGRFSLRNIRGHTVMMDTNTEIAEAFPNVVSNIELSPTSKFRIEMKDDLGKGGSGWRDI